MIGTGLCLGDHNRSGRPKTGYCGGVASGPTFRTSRELSFASEPLNIDPVLDGDSRASERAGGVVDQRRVRQGVLVVALDNCAERCRCVEASEGLSDRINGCHDAMYAAR